MLQPARAVAAGPLAVGHSARLPRRTLAAALKPPGPDADEGPDDTDHPQPAPAPMATSRRPVGRDPVVVSVRVQQHRHLPLLRVRLAPAPDLAPVNDAPEECAPPDPATPPPAVTPDEVIPLTPKPEARCSHENKIRVGQAIRLPISQKKGWQNEPKGGTDDRLLSSVSGVFGDDRRPTAIVFPTPTPRAWDRPCQ